MAIAPPLQREQREGGREGGGKGGRKGGRITILYGSYLHCKFEDFVGVVVKHEQVQAMVHGASRRNCTASPSDLFGNVVVEQ